MEWNVVIMSQREDRGCGMECSYYVIKREQRLCNGMELLCHKERAEAV